MGFREFLLEQETKVTGFITNIEKDTIENNNFRKILYTGKNSQLVLMSLKPEEEIGDEIHEQEDQFFRVEKGKAKFIINDEEFEVDEDFSVIVPAGISHNIVNIGNEDLKLYTIYSPPHHKDGGVFETKEEAEENEESFDGETTE